MIDKVLHQEGGADFGSRLRGEERESEGSSSDMGSRLKTGGGGRVILILGFRLKLAPGGICVVILSGDVMEAGDKARRNYSSRHHNYGEDENQIAIG